jgi:hypothetical protein
MKITKERLVQIIKEEVESLSNESMKYDIGPKGAIEPRNDLPSVDPEEIGADFDAPDFEEVVAQLREKYPKEKYPEVDDDLLRAMVQTMFSAMSARGY